MDPNAVLHDLQELFVKHGIAGGTLAIPTPEGQFLLLSHAMPRAALELLGHSLINHPGFEVTKSRMN